MAGEAHRRRLRELLALAGVRSPRSLAPFDAAFVHESAVAEKLAGQSNERLEFYGDAVLGYAAACYLFDRYPDGSEGELTRRRAALVSGAAIARTATRLGFEALMTLGTGQRANGVLQSSILGDAFEAFIATLAREADLKTAVHFIEKHHFAPFERAGDGLDADAKTALQELAQKLYRVTPTYRDSSEGPPHERRFTVYVDIGGEEHGPGYGASKKAAQQAAAAIALTLLTERDGAEPCD
jgi:ribonuclease-3